MGLNDFLNKNSKFDSAFQQKVSITNFIQRLKIWADEGRGAFKDTGYIPIMIYLEYLFTYYFNNFFLTFVSGDEELPKPKRILTANHPFFFVIKMNNTCFMMGHFSI